MVRDGEVHVTHTQGGIRKFIGIQGRGSIFGEVSLLTGQPHSSDATAALDSKLFVIRGDTFLSLMSEEPILGHNLSVLLSKRLRTNINERIESPARIHCFVYPEDPERGSFLAWHIAHSLPGESTGSVLVLSSPDSPAFGMEYQQRLQLTITAEDLRKAKIHDLPYDFLYVDWEESLAKNLAATFGLYKKYYENIFVDLYGIPRSDLLTKILSQCDTVILVASHPSRDTSGFKEWYDFIRHNPDVLEEEIQVVADLRSGYQSLSTEERRIKIKTGVEQLSHEGNPLLDRYVARLARLICGTQRGLILGGGGARALAEIGIVSLLEEEGIDFDAVVGVSMGAVIGAGMAMGWPAKELAKRLKELIPDSQSILDKCLPFVSFFRGRKISNLLRKGFGNIRFEDLEIPFFCNGSDLDTGRMIVFEKGYLATAIRGSISLPGIFPPFHLGRHSIVDGGVLNNLPGQILRERGFKRIVGINVTPTVEQMSSKTTINPRKGLRGLWAYITLPPILSIVNRALATQAQELQNFRIADLDYVVHPDTSQFDMFDFHRIDEIVRVGRATAEREIDQIKEVLKTP